MSLLDQVGGLVARLKPDMPTDPMAYAHGAIGAPVSRLDGPLKTMGRARFAAEVQAPNLTYAALVLSTIANGRIATMDTDAAEHAAGVLLVMTYRNAPKLKAPPAFGSSPQAVAISSLPIMQDDSIKWNGEPVAVVVAETQLQADHAASLVRVTYEAEPADTDFKQAQSHERVLKTVMREPGVVQIGEAEKALAAAPHRVDLQYVTPRHMHCAIEPHAVTVLWEDGRLIVHDATQMIHGTRYTLAQVFGLTDADVRVLSPYVGGGFGSKGFWSHQVLAAAASRLVERPVRLALSREAVFRVTGGRTPTEQRVALGAEADGTLKALIHTGVVAMTPHNNVPEQFSFPARHLYQSESFYLEQRVADMHMVANCFMRAPGESVGTFALECALDELAEQLAMDPVALRAKLEPAKDPTTGHGFSARHLTEAYRRGAERFGWSGRNPTPRARREGDWLIGMGVATGTYPYYRMPGGAARIRLTAEGKVTVQMGAHEMGMGTATVQAQQCAQRLGVPMSDVTFEYGDSDLPAGTVAGGSSQTVSIGMAVIAAYEVLRKDLLKLAGNDSPLAGLAADEVEGAEGGLRCTDDPSRHETYQSILARAQRDEISAEANAPAPTEIQKYSMHSYAAQFAEVRVNAVTGETRVSRFVGSFDAGRILNPKMAASQFRGGIIMGIGLALTEELLFDPRNGRVANASLAEYHVPVHLDVPDIDVIWNDTPDPYAPMGARGIGEIGITGVGAAIANAVYNATGIRVRDLPITLDKLL